MPLIDGKYELISERPLGPRRTLFEATAPDGAAVRIVWFELDPSQEGRFEQYRRTVKRLKRAGRAAIYDVVARPGAHYVAWRPPLEAKAVPPDAELARALEDAGFRPEDADIRRDGRRPVVFDLAFDGSPLPSPESAAPAAARSLSRRAAPLPDWVVSVGLTVLLMSLALVFLRAGLLARSNDRLLLVPQLEGRNVNEAARELHRIGLRADAIAVASEQSAGTVVASDPAAGTQLRPGRGVRLSYALPPGSVTPAEVPRVVTLHYPDEALQSIEEAGLQVGSVSRIPAAVAAGLVISQRPAAGRAVGAGSKVDLLVSAGPQEVATFLPDLVGLPVEEARYLARLAGLQPERIREDRVPAASGRDGTVLAQSLRPYQPIAVEESVLRLIVADVQVAAIESSGLPSFVGMPRAQAHEISPGGLEVRFQEISNRSLPEGVVDQNPSAGSRGSEVVLTLNVHPIPIPQPQVRARVREPEPRELAYRWFIEPGIPVQQARVYATTLEGERLLVRVESVRGGDSLEGTWRTREPGPVRFTLTLNGEPYGGEQLVR